MSAEVATGCCSSWVQGVSVVPISQYRDHGMKNRTDFSVCRIRPTSPRIRSRGTTMWMPLEASTRSPPPAPDSDSVSSVQTPVELITARARIRSSRPVSRSTTTAPSTAPDVVLRELHELGARGGEGPVGRCRADQGEDQPGVVDRGVPVLQGADGRIVAQVGELAQHALARQVPVVGQGPTPPGGRGQGVVEGDARPHVGALPHPVLQGVEECHGLDQVGCELVDQQVALGEGLVDEVEVEHLQVAQAPVDQFRGAARRPARPVLGLHDADAQSAGGGLQCDAGAGHAAPDDEDVEAVVVAHLRQGLGAGRGGHDGRQHGWAPQLGLCLHHRPRLRTCARTMHERAGAALGHGRTCSGSALSASPGGRPRADGRRRARTARRTGWSTRTRRAGRSRSWSRRSR